MGRTGGTNPVSCPGKCWHGREMRGKGRLRMWGWWGAGGGAERPVQCTRPNVKEPALQAPEPPRLLPCSHHPLPPSVRAAGPSPSPSTCWLLYPHIPHGNQGSEGWGETRHHELGLCISLGGTPRLGGVQLCWGAGQARRVRLPAPASPASLSSPGEARATWMLDAGDTTFQSFPLHHVGKPCSPQTPAFLLVGSLPFS